MSNTKQNAIIISLAGLAILGGCNINMGFSNRTAEAVAPSFRAGEATNGPVYMPDSFIVCRSKQCAPANISMSAEYIYNSLVSLFQNNAHQTALVCEGNGSTHSCIETYVSMPITVGVTPAYAYIDSVKISDVNIQRGKKSISLLLNYNLTYNGQTPTCTPAQSLAYVKDAKNIILQDSGYNCKMTSISSSNVKTLLAVDYIDLDYGFIGGYYSIGLSGPAYGGGNGYMLIRLPKDAYPLTPSLKAPKEKKLDIVTEYTSSGNLQADEHELFDNVQVFPIKK